MPANRQTDPQRPATRDAATDLLPQLERPTRALALHFARTLFVNGERIDMGLLASRLGVGRTTLYRWVGDREQLLALVLADFVDAGWEHAMEVAEGRGAEHAVNAAAQFIQTSTAFMPLRDFSRAEPALALRLLMGPDSIVNERVRAGLRRTLDLDVPDRAVSDEIVDAAVQVATALGWAPIVMGEEPPIDRAVQIAATLIRTGGRGQPA